jgi:hypothetical protein
MNQQLTDTFSPTALGRGCVVVPGEAVAWRSIDASNVNKVYRARTPGCRPLPD